MGFAVFLEPQEELSSAIQAWKKMIELNLPDQPYCSHPPHCTLIHVEVSNEQEACLEIKKILEETESLKVEVDQVGIFWEDLATGGGHTLHLKIKPEPEIFCLQLKIAEILRPLVQLRQIPDYISNDSVLKESYKSYGFPFVGMHWVPHFSIASLRTDRIHPIITEFMGWKPSFTMTGLDASCWHIDGDQHILLERQLLD